MSAVALSQAVRKRPGPDALARAGAPSIRVARVAAADYAGWDAAFEHLAKRDPSANPFMAPAIVAARRGRIGDDAIVVLAAWREGSASPQLDPSALVGLWVLRRRRDLWSGGLSVLQAPLEPRHDADASPVLDRDHAAAAMEALLKAAFALSPVIRASAWPDDRNALLPNMVSCRMAERWTRAVLDRGAAPGLMDQPRVRKRLKQERALAKQGVLEAHCLRGSDAARGVDTFLALEAGGWKGQAGTALAKRGDDRADLLAVFDAFAARDRLAVDVLTLDGRPIAAGVQIEAGAGQVFWRTAYDEALARHSPGMLLDLAVTRRVIAAGRPMLDSGMGPFTRPDSQIWPGRRVFAVATLFRHASMAGRVVALLAAARAALRGLKHGRAAAA
jgi:hypothetical protein